MAQNRIPFENRWTSGTNARHWFLRLEREGLVGPANNVGKREILLGPGDRDELS